MHDDDRRIRLLRWAVAAVLAMGVAAFLVRGADRPADPFLEPGPPGSPSEPGQPPAAEGGASPGPPGDPGRVPLEGFGEVAVRVLPAGGGDWLSWCLLAARTAAQRSQGLMGVTDLQGYPGMAFVYEQDVANAFFMRNTPTPLSIAWISAGGELVSTADMDPCEDRDDCPTYPPAGPYRYAIEVPRGELPAMGITPGARVEVGGACAPRA